SLSALALQNSAHTGQPSRLNTYTLNFELSLAGTSVKAVATDGCLDKSSTTRDETKVRADNAPMKIAHKATAPPAECRAALAYAIKQSNATLKHNTQYRSSRIISFTSQKWKPMAKHRPSTVLDLRRVNDNTVSAK